jgi:cytochrome P450
MISATMDKDDGLGKNTVFNNIVKAGEDTGRFAFQEREVVGNLFTLLFAGHGTRTHVSL